MFLPPSLLLQRFHLISEKTCKMGEQYLQQKATFFKPFCSSHTLEFFENVSFEKHAPPPTPYTQTNTRTHAHTQPITNTFKCTHASFLSLFGNIKINRNFLVSWHKYIRGFQTLYPLHLLHYSRNGQICYARYTDANLLY